MKLVFASGPYRAATERDVLGNIRRAEVVALRLWRMGAAVVCPHKNTAHFGGAAPDNVWLEGDKEIIRRSGAVVCLEGWERSEGARGEVALARQLGIRVFQSVEEARLWLESQP